MAEVFGTGYFETAKDKLKALMDELVSDMAAGFDPAIDYAYDYHNVADMDLNAVSQSMVASALLDNVNEDASEIGAGAIYDMQFSMRVHTDHVDGTRDVIKNTRLLESVNNKLLNNVDLGDGYRVRVTTDFEYDAEFEESDTYGAQLTVVIRLYLTITQE